MLLAKASALKGVTPFMHQYASGGLFGVRVGGDAGAASENLKAVVAELKVCDVYLYLYLFICLYCCYISCGVVH